MIVPDDAFALVHAAPRLPAACMARIDSKRCLAPADTLIRIGDGFSTACDEHAEGRIDGSAKLPSAEAAAALRSVNPPPAATVTRPDWDEYFFGLAEAASKRADCLRKRVGAVLVGPDHRVLSTGYNGAPAGVPGCATERACPRGARSYGEVQGAAAGGPGYDVEGSVCISDHAEWNAVLYARPASRRGATMYITHAPCPRCAALMAAVGITDVHWPEGSD
jgi:dCMP deaminase